MNAAETLSTHFDKSHVKGNHTCTYYPLGNANGLEVQEILS